jgi:hypothetical protein
MKYDWNCNFIKLPHTQSHKDEEAFLKSHIENAQLPV